MDPINWIGVFKHLSNKKKKRLKVTCKGIKACTFKKRFQKKETSADEIENYVRNHGLKSRLQLIERIRSGDEDAPAISAIRKYFGTWTKLWEKIYGIRYGYVEYNAEELIKLFVHLKIYDVKAYMSAKRRDRYLIPSQRQIYKHFGKFALFFRIVKANSNESIFERYIALYKSSGKIPTKTECRKNGVEIDKLLKIMDESELHVFINYLKKREKNEK